MNFNYSIFLLLVKDDFRSIRLKKKLLIKSIFLKFKVVKLLIFENKFFPFINPIKFDYFSSSYKRLNLVYSLRKKFISKSFLKNYVSKKKGYSKFFYVSTIYDNCFRYLWYDFMIPIFEYFSDKSSYSFRPYRNHMECFFNFKTKINFVHKNNLFYSTVKLSPFLVKLSFFKNFPFDISVLKFWLRNNIYDSILSDNYVALNIFSSLVNFLCNGLVWIFHFYVLLIFLIFCC